MTPGAKPGVSVPGETERLASVASVERQVTATVTTSAEAMTPLAPAAVQSSPGGFASTATA